MRILLFVLLSSACICCNAQFSLSVNGGFSSSGLRQPKGGVFNPLDHSGGKGWQGNLQAKYAYKHWFVYAGAGLCRCTLQLNWVTLEGGYNATYHPLYAHIPAGVGYTAKLRKNLQASLFGGGYFQYGVGGKEVYNLYSWLPGAMLHNPNTKQITYGDGGGTGFPTSLARANVGLQIGTGLQWRRLRLQALYNVGLTNILPTASVYHLNLNTFALNLGYQLLGK